MSRVIICTTGTSIAPRGLKCGDPEAYRSAIREALGRESAELGQDATALVRKVSAETNSLFALGAGDVDRVVLLHTETPDGKVCAEEVHRLIEEHFECEVESPQQVAGLQVQRPEVFRRQGIQELFAKLDRYCKSGGGDVVLNVTGGFKSVVPYVTLYGLLNRHRITYLFEHSTTLLTLPPVPVSFDWERIGRAKEALRLLEREGVIAQDRFYEAIPQLPYGHRHWYECLIEGDQAGQVTLSVFGELVLDAARAEGVPVRLSSAAGRAYEASSGVARDQFTFMLGRLGDPLWRLHKRHPFSGTDLALVKPGNTAHRLAYYETDSAIYVCELYASHDRYERDLSGRMRSDYQGEQWRDWVAPVGAAAPPETEEEAFERLYEERELLQEELEEQRRAQDELAKVRHDLQEAGELAERAEHAAAERLWLLRREHEEQSRKLEAELQTLRADLALAGERAASFREAERATLLQAHTQDLRKAVQRIEALEAERAARPTGLRALWAALAALFTRRAGS